MLARNLRSQGGRAGTASPFQEWREHRDFPTGLQIFDEFLGSASHLSPAKSIAERFNNRRLCPIGLNIATDWTNSSLGSSEQ